MERRQFIKITGVSSLGMMAFPGMISCSSEGVASEYGLQVYTIRDALKKDFIGSLKQVANIGYNYIELFGYDAGKYFGYTIEETKKIIEDLGMIVNCSHIALGRSNPERIGTLMNGWEKAVEDAAKLGQKYIVCPYLQESERKSLDDYKSYADLFNKNAKIAKNYGLQFAYHNHNFEFDEMDGEIPYDILLNRCDKDLVKFEMDMYWMEYAGQDPFTYFDRFPGRFPLWHIKDISGDEDKFFTTVGDGVINWSKLFNHSKKAGLEFFYVEQDNSKNKLPFENIEKSLLYLKGLK